MFSPGEFGKQTIASLLAGLAVAGNYEAASAASNKLVISSTASVSE